MLGSRQTTRSNERVQAGQDAPGACTVTAEDLTPYDTCSPAAAGRPRRWRYVAVAVALWGLFMLVYRYADGQAETLPPVAVERRGAATDFTAASFAGGTLTLSAFRGRPVVMNFWASWCGPCRAEARMLEQVYEAYRDRDVLFLGVNIQDSEAGARSFLRSFNVTYPNVYNVPSAVPNGYAVVGLPTTVFIDREGRVVRRWVGPLQERQLVARIDDLLR